jgi:hypothetical protein
MKITAARRIRLLRISKIAVQDIETYPHRMSGAFPILNNDNDVVVKVAQTSSAPRRCRQVVILTAVVATRHVLFSSIQTGSFLKRRLHSRL